MVTLTLPHGTSDTFVWKGQVYPLKEGKQEIVIKVSTTAMACPYSKNLKINGKVS